MIEVEIRAKVSNLSAIRDKILALGGKSIKSERQIDKVFGREKDLDKDHQIIEGHFSARVRQKGDKKLAEFKEIKRTGNGHEFSCPIENIEDGVFLLESLDFVEAFTIDKTRELLELDNYKICLDQVDRLGNFIEIEREVADKNLVDDIVAEEKELLARIDSLATIEPRKYGDLMQELINQEV